MPIRRIETRSGLRYIENGRFIPSSRGAREFVRENIQTIRENRTNGLQYSNLSTRERQSYSAQNRYRFNGSFVPNPFNYLRQFEPTTQGQRELSNFITRDELNELQRNTFTIPFQADSDGDGNSMRLRGELTDLASEFISYMRQGYDFVLTTQDGEEETGLQAVDYLRRWETNTIERIRREGLERGRDLDRIRINYDVSINIETRRIELNLNDIDEDTDIEAWFNTP